MASVRFRDFLEHFARLVLAQAQRDVADRKSTRLNSSHSQISYAVFCLKKKKNNSTHNHADSWSGNHGTLTVTTATIILRYPYITTHPQHVPLRDRTRTALLPRRTQTQT